MAVIVNALRTPIGKLHGSLASISPENLTSLVISNSFSNLGVSPSIVEEVVVGQTKQSSHAPNIARIASLMAKFPENIPAYTVHRQCGSGMQSVHEAYMHIKSGISDVVIAAGTESMSQAPYYLLGNELFNHKSGHFKLYDSNIESQPKSQPDTLYGKFNMGETAEYLAKKYNISRQEQDEFALKSQEKAKQAIEKGKFLDEIVPVELDKKNKVELITTDEHPRDTNLKKLAQLSPVFQKNGTITAGNSSGRNDGAAALIIMSEKKAASLGLEPIAKIIGIGTAGVHPKEMGLGPIPASVKALKMAGVQLTEIDLIELNEAFAAQALAVLSEWDITDEKVNVNGGAIALGHPLGCTGTRIIVTLLHELRKSGKKYGLATLCIAGGQGIATVVENYKV